MHHRDLALTCVGVLAAAAAVAHAQTPATAPPSLVGAWTLNKDLSDVPQGRSAGESGQGQEGQRREGGGGRRGGRRGGGGFGGGGFGGSSAGEDAQRLRNALRDEMDTPAHLTITQSETTVVMTAGDGRTTRLSTDGKKIKDDSTKVERKTKWDGAKLVSEISGLGQGKITETYSVDADLKQLRVTLLVDGRQRKTTVNRVYDADPQ